jgi:SNF2 family DNA or RNA helicase
MMDFTGLLEPQKKHTEKLFNSVCTNGIALDFSKAGLGKTFSASCVAKNIGGPTYVVCPRVVRRAWRKVLGEFGVENPTILTYQKLMRGNTEFLSYDLNKFHSTKEWWKSIGINLNFPKNSTIILDELHNCKGARSLNSELPIALKNNGYRVLGLSASAATHVQDMKAIGYISNLHHGSNFKEWMHQYGARYTETGLVDWDGDQTIPHAGMRKIHHNLYHEQKMASKMHRRDFKGIFPDNHRIVERIDLGVDNTGKINHIHDMMAREIAELDKRSSGYRNHIFAIQMKARRLAEIQKVPAMVEWIQDMYDEGNSPVLFVNFKDTIDAVQRLLGKKYKDQFQRIDGDSNEPERDIIIETFQADIKRIIVVSASAGGEGIGLHDLHGNYPRVSWIIPSWQALKVIQCDGRIPRANGKTPCVQKFVYAAGTIEERQADRLEKRLDNLDLLTDGDFSIDRFDFSDYDN